MQISTHETRELLQLLSFLQTTGFLPFTTIERGGNPPDFILHYRNNKSAIELSELFKYSGRKHSEQELEAAERAILNEVKKEIEKHFPNPINVKISFCEPIGAERGYDIKKISKDLLSLIKRRLTSAPVDFEKISIASDEIGSQEISAINIRNGVLNGHRWLKSNRFERVKCHWVKRDPIEEIQSAIRRKEQGLEKYRNRFKKSYLLLTANRIKGSQSFECTEKLKEYYFRTNFDSVFLFDCFTKAAFILKNEKR